MQFFEPPDYIPLLPKIGTYKHPQYGEIVVSRERNERFVSNFRNQVYQPRLPVDAEHSLKVSGAMGWITDMRLNEDGTVDGKVEWTERGKTMLLDNRFAYISPEWWSKWQQPDTGEFFEDVLIGAALCTRPFFKHESLRPLVASERGIDAPTVEAGNTESLVDVVSDIGATEMSEEKKVAEQPQVTAQQFGELQSQFAELNSRYAAAEEARTEAQNRAQKFQEALDTANARVASLEAAAQRQRFGEVVTGWYGKAEDNVDMLVKLAQAFGEGSTEFAGFVTQQKAIAEQLKSSNLFAEIGTNKPADELKTAAQKFSAAVNAVMVDRKLNYADASVAVAGEQPNLYSEYVKEQRGK